MNYTSRYFQTRYFQRAKSYWYLCLSSYWTVSQTCSNSQVHPHAGLVRCPHVHGCQHTQWDAVHRQAVPDVHARQAPARLSIPQTCPS